MQFYVYEWFNLDTNEIFYIGKGCRDRYKSYYKRNKLFQDYYKKNNCDNRIIKFFDNEQSAFEYEHNRIMELKEKKQAQCNLDNGGKGGYNFTWTDELKKYKSQYNPMKREQQRKRMSENNPMKNKEVMNKVIEKKRKKVIIDGEIYNSIIEASIHFNKSESGIDYWLKRGYSNSLQPCYFLGEKEKPFILRTHDTSSKPVLINNVYFENVKTGAKHIGVWSESLIRAIKNNRLCKGHKCEYVNQQPSTNLND